MKDFIIRSDFSMKPPFENVIWDVDGTIANTFDIVVEILQEIAPRYGIMLDPEIPLEEFRNKSIKQIIAEFSIPAWKLPFIIRSVSKRLQDHLYQIELYPGIAEALNDVRSNALRMGLLTTSSRVNVDTILKANKIDLLFDFKQYKVSLWSKGKAISKLIRKYRLDSDKTCYIGDEVRDVEAMREAGIAVIAVTWGYNSKARLTAAKPDFIVDQPAEILPILRGF